MKKLVISGFTGRMGLALRALVNEDPLFADFEIAAGFDQIDGEIGGTSVFSKPGSDFGKIPSADVVVDFSNYTFVPEVLRYCIETKTPAVIATTALGENELELLREAAKVTAIFRSANMSLGVNLVAKMSKLAAPAVEDGFNIEIIETHHNQKKDAPSGTAILLADAINDSLRERKEYIYGRYGRENTQGLSEIGIHAVRGGTMPGRHTVMFAGPDEVIEITHTVYSQKVFAIGALKAAGFLPGKPPGLYDMNDLIG